MNSPVWDAKLLGEAMARKAAGEQWYEILIPEEKRQINVTQEQAALLARQAIEAAYGADALEGYTLSDAHAHVDFDGMDEDGHGLWRYSVSYDRLSDGLLETYWAGLYADDGGVIDCGKRSEAIEETPVPEEIEPQKTESPESCEARQRATLTIEEVEAIARDAIETTYGLTREQMEQMETVWDYETYPYDMLDGKPVLCVWFWLAQEEEEHLPGDGLYEACVNVETGVIESILYDSGLSGNG